MVIIKVKRDTKGGLKYLKNAIQYLEDGEKSLYTAGFGVTSSPPQDTYKQMVAVRRYFGKESGNPLMHFVVSFDERVGTLNLACILADQLVLYFRNQYQVLWTVHFKQRGCSSFHVHIIINTVSFVDGKMYHSSAAEIEGFRRYAEFVLENKVRWDWE